MGALIAPPPGHGPRAAAAFLASSRSARYRTAVVTSTAPLSESRGKSLPFFARECFGARRRTSHRSLGFFVDQRITGWLEFYRVFYRNYFSRLSPRTKSTRFLVSVTTTLLDEWNPRTTRERPSDFAWSRLSHARPPGIALVSTPRRGRNLVFTLKMNGLALYDTLKNCYGKFPGIFQTT